MAGQAFESETIMFATLLPHIQEFVANHTLHQPTCILVRVNYSLGTIRENKRPQTYAARTGDVVARQRAPP